jgi:hypothetical protein
MGACARTCNISEVLALVAMHTDHIHPVCGKWRPSSRWLLRVRSFFGVQRGKSAVDFVDGRHTLRPGKTSVFMQVGVLEILVQNQVGRF